MTPYDYMRAWGWRYDETVGVYVCPPPGARPLAVPAQSVGTDGGTSETSLSKDECFCGLQRQVWRTPPPYCRETTTTTRATGKAQPKRVAALGAIEAGDRDAGAPRQLSRTLLVAVDRGPANPPHPLTKKLGRPVFPDPGSRYKIGAREAL